MQRSVIRLESGVLSEKGRGFGGVLNFELGEGETVAVVGGNGVGKTTLAETLLGRHALCRGRLAYGGAAAEGGVRYIAFYETYNRAEDGEYYYQQRWNSCDCENAPRVEELFARVVADEEQRALCDELCGLLGLESLRSKPVVMLSSGELRKFQIVRMLLTRARVLVVDNPYIGLDVEARRVMDDLLERLVRQVGVQLVLLVADEADVPAFVTHVYRIEAGRRLGEKRPRETLGGERPSVSVPRPVLPAAERPPVECEEVVRLEGVTIRYGSRTILRALDWVLRAGEKWALAGPNGSGKSTLLSLISADNPQAYAQDITLFGRRRGTGESIWAIKRRIGYVSAEMHRSFMRPIPTVNLVASGYFDSLGLYERPTEEQLAVAVAWMEVFGIGGLARRPFLGLSSGEQRLALLARAFVKDPDLLILDEPLSGLDAANKARVRGIIDTFCARPGKSLIFVSHEEADFPACLTRRLVLRRNG